MIRKYLFVFIAFIAVVILTVFIIIKTSGKNDQLLTAVAQKGPFESLVYSTGQLESIEADYIPIPEILKDMRLNISSLTIADLIKEGTYVDSGDYVATIDHAAIDDQRKSAMEELDRVKTELEDSKIDSSLTLSNQRDQIVNAQLDLEEKKITINESTYEAPSLIRKAEMDYKKAERKLEQMEEAYILKQKQEANKVDRKYINYKQAKERVDLIESVYPALKVTAPRAGIIGYYHFSGGSAIQTSSTISPRYPAIATYPKLNSLITSTYINEIDISKVKIGQKVTLGFDAFPGKTLYGQVSSIANIGQILPRSDAKVFEVKINVKGSEPELKPSMTTSNIIQTDYADTAVYVPIESVFKNDSLSYVFRVERQGRKIVRQIVEPGIENENYVVIKQGVKEGENLCLVEPKNGESFPYAGMEIYKKIKNKDKEPGAAKPGNPINKADSIPSNK
jgi:HlyD family secretion protein